MREIDQVRITLLRIVSGAVQLPQEIIDEMLKAFLHTRNAAIKVQAKTKGYLLRRKPSNYMDQGAAKAFSYTFADPGHILGRVGLKPSMYHRNRNTMTAVSRYREYQRRRTGTYLVYQVPRLYQAVRSGGTYSRNWSDVFNSLP
eukprot:scaffold31628_cov56-Phaeocystis_antarctica.AAC.3